MNFVTAGFFFTISLVLIIVKFLYRKKTLTINVEGSGFDLLDLKTKY